MFTLHQIKLILLIQSSKLTIKVSSIFSLSVSVRSPRWYPAGVHCVTLAVIIFLRNIESREKIFSFT